MLQRVPDGLLPLLANLDWFNVEDWWDRWERVGGLNLARDQWSVPVVDGWVAFVGLPLLSRVESAVNCGERVILGVSALPGCVAACSAARMHFRSVVCLAGAGLSMQLRKGVVLSRFVCCRSR